MSNEYDANDRCVIIGPMGDIKSGRRCIYSGRVRIYCTRTMCEIYCPYRNEEEEEEEQH